MGNQYIASASSMLYLNKNIRANEEEIKIFLKGFYSRKTKRMAGLASKTSHGKLENYNIALKYKRKVNTRLAYM